jgi:hypothetical protein
VTPFVALREEKAMAEAYTQLVVAYWSTRQHKRRLALNRLQRYVPWVTAKTLATIGVDKKPTGNCLAEAPPDITYLLWKEGMIR